MKKPEKRLEEMAGIERRRALTGRALRPEQEAAGVIRMYFEHESGESAPNGLLRGAAGACAAREMDSLTSAFLLLYYLVYAKLYLETSTSQYGKDEEAWQT